MSAPLSVVCWLWSQKNGRATYTPKAVAAWASMISRNLAMPHRLFCFTDQPQSAMPASVTALPLPNIDKVESPHWPSRRPQCYRRIQAFRPEYREMLGERFVSMDLDVVVTGGLDALFSRDDDIVLNAGLGSKNCYNGSLWMYRFGTRDKVWQEWTPEASRQASAAYLGSDQAWLCHVLGDQEARWDHKDGVYQWLWLRNKKQLRTLPKNSRIVFFAGGYKPWDDDVQRQYPWVEGLYR